MFRLLRARGAPCPPRASTKRTGSESSRKYSRESLDACSPDTIGHYAHALTDEVAGRGPELIDDLIESGLAFRSAGMLSKALVELEQARALAERLGDPVREAQALSDRAVQIIKAAVANDPPPRIASNQDYVVCRWCDYAGRCWGTGS